jgi:ubiquinone/menaquinone biosynthesis C-methylase UbiE
MQKEVEMNLDHRQCTASLLLKGELQDRYDKFAPRYDFAEGIPEFLGVRKLRRRLLQGAYGDVLEVGVGTGKNLCHYSKACRVTGIDLSRGMLEIALRRAKKMALKAQFLVMDGETLAFPDQTFDVVVDTLNLCTFLDPVNALCEMSRVCRTEGRILLLEHGRSDREWLGRWQDRKAVSHAKKLGCQWNREPLELVKQSRLHLTMSERVFFGIFHLLEAAR